MGTAGSTTVHYKVAAIDANFGTSVGERGDHDDHCAFDAHAAELRRRVLDVGPERCGLSGV